MIIPGIESGPSFIFAKREFRLLNQQYPAVVDVAYLHTTGGVKSFLLSIFEIYKKVSKSDYDILHAQYGTITALVATLLSFRKKLVITFRGSDINGAVSVSTIRRKTALFFSWFSMAFADAVVFVSPSLKNKGPRLFNHAVVIPSGVDTSVFFMRDLVASKKRIGLEADKSFVLFYSSNNSQNKRPDLANGAIELLKKEGLNVELLNILGNIPPEEMPYYVSSSDVVLMVSDNEGSPTIVQEALACGVPVVTVDVGDAVSMINGVDNSVVVQRNIQSISEGIKSCLGKGRAAPPESILARISLKSNISKLYSVYTTLLRG